MDQSPCKLTLVFPLAAENRIVELLLETTPPIGGFTTIRAEGHGQGFADASVSERVRGRVSRSMLIAVMNRGRADQLLAELEAKAPLQHLAYWLEPVIAFGRMAPVSSRPTTKAGDGTGGESEETVQEATGA